MISDQAKNGMQCILKNALNECFSVNGQQPVISDTNDMTSNPNTLVTVLTVTTYIFKLVLMIGFEANESTKQYFLNESDQELDPQAIKQALCDVISEKENLCCGILSRELAEFFPHIGMSTPSFIDSGSLSFIQQLQYDDIQFFNLDCGQEVNLQVALCICAYDDVDFTVTMTENTAETGELELF